MNKIVSIFAMSVMLMTMMQHAQARLLFSNETDYTKGDTFIIDFDDNAGDEINLTFGGGSNSGSIVYDTVNETFDIDRSVDFEGNQVLNFRMQNDPNNLGIETPGMTYFNTVTNRLRYYDGTQWIEIGSGSVLNIAEAVGVYVGVTDTFVDGSITTATLTGYLAGNYMCDQQVMSGSHMCQVGEMINSIADGPAFARFAEVDSIAGWVSEGAPGFTSNSNDCGGWSRNDTNFLGSWWDMDEDTGGKGYLVTCATSQPIACCSNAPTP